MVIDLGFFEVLTGVYSDVERMCSELVSLSIVSLSVLSDGLYTLRPGF